MTCGAFQRNPEPGPVPGKAPAPRLPAVKQLFPSQASISIIYSHPIQASGYPVQSDMADSKILIIDDEWESAIVKAVQRRLEEEGWRTVIVEPQSRWLVGDEFEAAAIYVIEAERPDGVLLDVRLGEHRDDQFKGLEILRYIVEHYPTLPVLMFTQYAQGPARDTAVRGALRWNAPVDYIDKLASPEEVVLRLRRLIGAAPELIPVGRTCWWTWAPRPSPPGRKETPTCGRWTTFTG